MPRLLGEVGRTSGQLRLFAGVVEEGSWVNARIDPALPDRQPMPRADIRSMLRPLGPVAVFGASNFPLAFSVAGGDTASALAAGCPVVVKAHPAHPGTSEIVAQIIDGGSRSGRIASRRFLDGLRCGIEAGAALVKHPLIRAVAFTGSLRAGRALMDLAAARPDPIPCFTEMSSGNPVFVLPGALRKGPAELAKGLFGSFTLGAGQFCTKPGIVLVARFAGRRKLSWPRSSTCREGSAFHAAHAGDCPRICTGHNGTGGASPNLRRMRPGRKQNDSCACACAALYNKPRQSVSQPVSGRGNLRTRHAAGSLRKHQRLSARRACSRRAPDCDNLRR